MKKIFLIVIFVIFSFANVNNYKIYEDYTNKILNYSLKLKTPINNPFNKPVFKAVALSSYKVIAYKKKARAKLRVKAKAKPKPNFKIISIFRGRILSCNSDKVWLSCNYNGKTEKKWLKVGESVRGYKVVKIEKGFIVLKNGKEIEKVVYHKTYNNKINIKVSK